MSRKRICINEDDGNCLVRFREVQQCSETSAEAPVPVQPQPVPVHPSQKSPIANLYRYSTNLYRYRRVRFAGIGQDYESNARVRSSFNYQCGITMEKGIKAKGKREKAVF